MIAPGSQRPAEGKDEKSSSPPIAEEDARKITELYEKLNRTDHYALLGVEATADTKAIKRAYYLKAKEHHPDRWFRKDIGALRPKIDAIFAAIAAAEATLTHREKRASYDLYLREVLKTKMARRQAMALEARKDWPKAADAWARIVENVPTDPYVQHRYAYAILRSGNAKLFTTATAAATRAIELDTTRAEYRITAASLHLAQGRDRSALAQLSIAMEIEPGRSDIAALHAALSARVASTRA